MVRRALQVVAAIATLTLVLGFSASRAMAEGHSEEAAEGAESEARAAEHGGGHHEAPGEINWAQGFLGESDEAEPGLLYRPTGMPAPLLALLFDTAVVFAVVYYFGRQPLAEALKSRRIALLKGMDEAAAMKREAESQLAGYQDRLDHIEEEVARVEREMRAAGEFERERVLTEARRKREMMERDARYLVEMEAKAATEAVRVAAVRTALTLAQETLVQQASATDQRRFVDEYLETLRRAEIGGVS